MIQLASRRRWDRVWDYPIKWQEYPDLGVREFRVILRVARTMTIFRRPPAEPAELLIPEDGAYQTPLLPGFELHLARELAEADRWEATRTRRPRDRLGGGS